MKKNKKLFVTIILIGSMGVFFALLVSLNALSIFNKFLFVTKQISYFLLVTSFFLLVLFWLYQLLYDGFYMKFSGDKVLKIFTLVIFILSISVISALKINDIRIYETPIVSNYYLYDQYANRIYNGMLSKTEPSITIIQNDPYHLVLEIREKGTHYTLESENDSHRLYVPTDVTVDAYVQIEYDSNHEIIYYEIQWENTQKTAYSYGNRVYHLSSMLKVENAFDSDTFISTRSKAQFETAYAIPAGYYAFTPDMITTEVYTANRSNDQAWTIFYQDDEGTKQYQLVEENSFFYEKSYTINSSNISYTYQSRPDEVNALYYDADGPSSKYATFVQVGDLYVFQRLFNYQIDDVGSRSYENSSNSARTKIYSACTLPNYAENYTRYTTISAESYGYKSTTFYYNASYFSDKEIDLALHYSIIGTTSVLNYLDYSHMNYTDYVSETQTNRIIMEHNPLISMLS